MAANLTRMTQKYSDTTAPSGRELYHLQFSLQAASPETFGYTLVYERAVRMLDTRYVRKIMIGLLWRSPWASVRALSLQTLLCCGRSTESYHKTLLYQPFRSSVLEALLTFYRRNLRNLLYRVTEVQTDDIKYLLAQWNRYLSLILSLSEHRRTKHKVR
jgi:hypothetical protein